MPPKSNLRERAVEYYLNRFSHRTTLTNTEWQLDDGKLRDVTIRWPSRYEWDAASDWVELLLYGFRQHVNLESADDIPQDFKGTVVFQFVIDGKVRTVAIGYSDFRPIDDDCAKSCDLYFKMQFDAAGYPYDHVVPGGYVPDGKRLYYHLKGLRKLRDSREYLYDVYGRFGLDYAREIREKAVNILNNQDKFPFEGGMKPVAYADFLREVARSKICIDLPGLGDFCFRLINYLAVGSFVIAYPHGSVLNVPLVDRKHIVYCKEDFSDLIDLCEYYIENDREREEIAANARRFFDLYLHKDNLVKYYLKTILDRLA